MKVVLFHPSLLPPKDYGGVERVVLWLAKGLTERGHQVKVAAHAGSSLPLGVELLEVSSKHPSAKEFLRRIPKGTDVIHFMAPPEPEVWPALPCAGLLTVHGNGKPNEVFSQNAVFLSKDHATRHGASVFVYNGIDPSEYRFQPQEQNDQYLFLSKTSWRVKNVRGTIALCKRAGVPLTIAGGRRPFSARLGTLLSSKISWVGPVSGEKKAKLLSQAKALLFPILWPEPFGLVVVESLMSGVPVIASRLGSLPELVNDEVGALFDPHGDEDRWQEILKVEKLPWHPDACRNRAMELFHYLKMAESYEGLYLKVSAGMVLQAQPPVAKEWKGQVS